MILIPNFIISNKPLILPYRLTLIFTLLIGLNGKRTGSLNLSGTITAIILGYLTLANPLKLFGITLLTFYFIGSKITKFKSNYKLTLLEEESTNSTTSITLNNNNKSLGNRNSFQVICNSLIGTICSLIWRLIHSGEIFISKELIWNDHNQQWCVLDSKMGYSKVLILGAISFWSACSGDTFASELGILSRTKPFLITTFKTVPPGTNGGVSILGLILSALGGTLIGIVSIISLYFENSNCRTLKINLNGIDCSWWMFLILISTFSGFIGSLIDSILGATLQETLYSETKRKIVHSRKLLKVDQDTTEDKIKSIAGFNILSNNAVNFLSTSLTCFFIMYCFI